jgi:ABC-type siderophore export system fused ATPase/permease subunit
MVTHDNKVLDIADRIVALEAGALVETSPRKRNRRPTAWRLLSE